MRTMANHLQTGLDRIVKRLRVTWPNPGEKGSVKLDMDYFANVIDFEGTGLAICTDGIGSKAMVATMLDKYDTVGIDCVAMNVNDLVCVGATPLSMVDYIAIQTAKLDVLERIASGLVEGANMAGISICGGETAQLGEVVNGFDLAGTAVGMVPLDRILYGQEVRDGDVVIGIASNGIHSNGFTLARAVFQLQWDYGGHHNERVLAKRHDDLGVVLGVELMRPTFIYVQEALQLIRDVKSLKALVHITGDGVLNLNRVKAPVGFVIDNWPDIPAIFELIKAVGDVGDILMWTEFNMGIGFCAVVGEEDFDLAYKACISQGKSAYRIGYALRDEQRRIRLTQHGLMGYAKHIERMT